MTFWSLAGILAKPIPRPFRYLLLASILVPTAILILAAALDRDHRIEAAKEEASKTVAVLHEHTVKVMDTQELALAQIDDRSRGMAWDQIAADQNLFQDLRRLVERLPQVDGAFLIRPDGETFRVNAMGTYNVVEAAVKLGVRKVVVASSETTYGVCFSDGWTPPRSLPLEEDYDVDPMDSYGLSKVVNEVTARSFQRRSGADVYALRIGNVIEPHEYALFPGFFERPEVRRRNTFSYIDARDLGQIVHLCLEKDGLGYEVFNCGNDDCSANLPTRELVERFYPGVAVTRELGEFEALYSNRKIREVLGFREEHNWRKYVKG